MREGGGVQRNVKEGGDVRIRRRNYRKCKNALGTQVCVKSKLTVNLPNAIKYLHVSKMNLEMNAQTMNVT